MIFLFLIVLIISIGLWAFFVEPNMIKVERVSIELEGKNLARTKTLARGLPLSPENLKIVQLSDLHSKNFGRKEKKLLGVLKDIEPDFIFITGDIVDWTTKDLASCQKFWQKLSQNYQGRVFGVLGNHEHLNPRFKDLLPLFKESGIEILNNRAKKITIDGDSFYLIGVDDPHLGYDDIEKAMAGMEEKETLKILLAHSPEIFRKVKDKDIDLVLTGHTHGGQVNIPVLVDFILPLKYDKKYKRGLFKDGKTYLYVNQGIGTTVLPFRFNAFPEVTLIQFK